MLEALMHGRVDSGEINWVDYIEDVETLNRWALKGRLDVTKLSFSTWLRVQNSYTLLSAGAALGHGCGPLLIAKTPMSEEEVISRPVAIPGALTTANLLFTLRYPNALDKRAMLFSEIESAVLDGSVASGVIIHENRFTYASKGLVQIVDLGTYWEELTGSPIPLGAFAIKRSLGTDVEQHVSNLIKNSVEYAFANRDVVMPYVKSHAQEMDAAVMQAHIDTYVNKFSLDLGDEGLRAVALLQERAAGVGIS